MPWLATSKVKVRRKRPSLLRGSIAFLSVCVIGVAPGCATFPVLCELSRMSRGILVLGLVPSGFFQRKGATPMTMQDLIASLRPLLPNFLLDEESDGEILVYTGFRETESGSLEEVEEPE